jgi:hypothetical protein
MLSSDVKDSFTLLPAVYEHPSTNTATMNSPATARRYDEIIVSYLVPATIWAIPRRDWLSSTK